MHWSIFLLSAQLLHLAQAKRIVLSPAQLQRSIPALPLGLSHLLRSTPASELPTSPSTQLQFSSSPIISSPYPVHLFPQQISHDPAVPAPVGQSTFNQRYWFDDTYYVEGGPIFLLDGGETSGEVRLPFLEQGILQILAEATGGMGVVFEHRYYGESFPVSTLTTDSFVYLTTSQSLSDSAHFARTISFPGRLSQLNLTSSNVPYIYIGGSYAGAKSAFARKLFPDVFMGAIASSAVTTAIEDFWEYYQPIMNSAPPKCIENLLSHTAHIDSLFSFQQPFLSTALKSFFGLDGITSDADFVNALTIPLSTWQARNWDKDVGNTVMDEFCAALEQGEEEEMYGEVPVPPQVPGMPEEELRSFLGYATWIKENVASLCPEGTTQDECFATAASPDAVGLLANGESIEENAWKSWPYQVCTEWGYFIGAPPTPEIPSIVSRLLTTNYTRQICALAFPDGEFNQIPATPNLTMINQYGSYDLKSSRSAFVDGSADPWLYATPHSPHATHPNRTDSIERPFKLIEGGVHHWDENGRLDGNVPLVIQKIHQEEINFVRTWLEEWNTKIR